MAMITESVSIWVPGIPKPGGSKRFVGMSKKGHAILVDACKKNADWKSVTANTAATIMMGRALLCGPLSVSVVFYMPRPKDHFRSSGALKPKAPNWHTKKPDATKLWRSTEDALSGVVWRDDALIVVQHVRKMYVPHDKGCGAQIEVCEVKEAAS
jgi:Holliday junction resolvase RusA-like endonuclease